MAEINLIPTEEISGQKIGARQAKLLTISIVLLVVTSAITTALFFAWALTINQINGEVSKQSQVAGQIDLYAKEEKLNKFVVDQAQTASQALSEQINFNSVLGQFKNLLPDGIKFTDLAASDKNIAVSGTASNSVALSTFISKTLDESTKSESNFSGLSITTLTGKDDGTFLFSMSIPLKNTKTTQR